MIDYYLHKKCGLNCPTAKQKINIRCGGCIWLDKKLRKCIFSMHYPKSITFQEFKQRINSVNVNQQNKLSEPFRRFVDGKMPIFFQEILELEKREEKR